MKKGERERRKKWKQESRNIYVILDKSFTGNPERTQVK